MPAISTCASVAASSVRRYAESSCASGRPEPPRVDRGGDAVHPSRATGQRLDEQVAEQQHLDTPRPQQFGERVVFLLRLGHPGQPVEQQRIVVAGRQPLHLGAGAVKDHDAQRANLRVCAQHRTCHV